MRLFGFIKRRRNPVKYWRDLGAAIGSNCEIYASAELGSEPFLINIGNHVRINSGVKIVTHDGGVWVLRKMLDNEAIDLFGPVKIGDNVHIGTDTIIMPGVTIGNNVIIGCGAVVTKNIPDNSIAVGVPARVIETVEEYANKHTADFDYTKQMTREEKRKYLEQKYTGGIE